jgi:hypothetical protein
MGKKGKGRVGRHATRAKSTSEDLHAEESESGDLSSTSSEKQRLFDTRAELRETKQESLRLAGDIAEDDKADDDDADDDDDDPPMIPRRRSSPRKPRRLCRLYWCLLHRLFGPGLTHIFLMFFSMLK